MSDVLNQLGLQSVKTKMSFTDLIPTMSVGEQYSTLKNWITNPSEVTDTKLQKLNDVFESIDFALTMVKTPVISLFVNPQSITVNKNVLLSKQVTKGGFVVQFWGHDLETITVNAETGYFGLSEVPLRAFNLFKDYCYQGRYNPRKPFKSIPILTMLYEGTALRGYFNNLSYTVAQARPYIITYNFTFTVTEIVSFPVVTALSKIADKFGRQYLTQDDLRSQVNIAKGWGVKLY